MSDRVSPMPTRRSVATLQAVRDFTGGGFDADAWHVMEERDNALIADEVLSGAGSAKFVYQFSVSGTAVTGISVIGARHLAAHYGGMKHELVASAQKVGALHTFTSFPQAGIPMDVRCAIVPELEAEDDYYSVIVKVTDLKSGNSITVEKRETRMEKKRDGSRFERPHYQIIAQSKAYRNAVLALIPQDVQLKFKLQMLQLDKHEDITGSVLHEKREGVLRFAGAKAIPVNRRAVEALTLAQISGLGDAARGGDVKGFHAAAEALGIIGGSTLQAVVAPAEERPAPQESKPGPKPKAQEQPPKEPEQPQQQETPVFEAVLVDEDGVYGPEDTYTDPIAYAQAFSSMVEKRAPFQQERIIANNADGISLVKKMSAAAAGILAEALEAEAVDETPKPATANGPDLAAAMPPLGSGRGAGDAWFKLASERLAQLDQAGRQRWVENNQATYAEFPQVQRVNMIRLLRQHGLPPIPAQQNGGESKAAKVEAICERIKDATDEDEVAALQKQGEGEAHGDAALLGRVRQTAYTRENELRAQAEEAGKD